MVVGVFLEAVEREVLFLQKYLDFAPDSTGENHHTA